MRALIVVPVTSRNPDIGSRGRRFDLMAVDRIQVIVIAIGVMNLLELSAQVYHPFPTADVTWTVGSGSSDCFMFGFGEGFARVQTTGDTLIQNVEYSKITEVYSNHACGIYQRSGAIRNDTIERKVYFIPEGALAEELLYDMSLLPGDVFDLFDIGPLMLDSIDSLQIDLEYHRRFNFTEQFGFQTYQVIEGVGSTIGVTSGYDTIDDDTWLICMERDGEQLFEFIPNACAQFTGYSEKPFVPPTIELSPNPVIDRLTVRMEEVAFKELIVCNMLGEVLVQYAAGLLPFSIDVSSMTEGMYVVELRHADSTRTIGRFVKD